MFLTSASPVTTICSPQYLLPSPTVIRQKRFFLFKKNAHDFLSAFTTPSAILVEQHLRQSDQPLTAKLVVQKVEARRKVKKRSEARRAAEGKTPRRRLSILAIFFSENYVYFDFDGKIFRDIAPTIGHY